MIDLLEKILVLIKVIIKKIFLLKKWIQLFLSFANNIHFDILK